MTYFALVYVSDLEANGLGYIWYNRQQHHLNDNTISVAQARYESVSEKKLLDEVKSHYPNAVLFDDTSNPGCYRCIKIR